MNRFAPRLLPVAAFLFSIVFIVSADPMESIESGFAQTIRSAASAGSGAAKRILILDGVTLRVFDGAGAETCAFGAAELGGEPTRVVAMEGGNGRNGFVAVLALPLGGSGLRLMEIDEAGETTLGPRLDDGETQGSFISMEYFSGDPDGTYVVAARSGGLSVALLGFGRASSTPSVMNPFEGFPGGGGQLAGVESWGLDDGRLFVAAAFSEDEGFRTLAAEFRDGALVGRSEIGMTTRLPRFRTFSDPSGVALVVEDGMSYAVHQASAAWRRAVEGEGELVAIAPVARVDGPWFAFVNTDAGLWAERMDLASGVTERGLVAAGIGASPRLLPIVDGGTLRFAVLSELDPEDDVIVALDPSASIARTLAVPRFRPEGTIDVRAYGGPRGTIFLAASEGISRVLVFDDATDALVDAGLGTAEAASDFPYACLVNGHTYLALDAMPTAGVAVAYQEGTIDILKIVGTDSDAFGAAGRLLAVEGSRLFTINIQE
ncbi:MAG: hypothetical protein JXA15_13895 [Spirochaetales bacterium]|nr:hypothetical protein [Spirochaetales bacterium]